jgi:hypothetical protein
MREKFAVSLALPTRSRPTSNCGFTRITHSAAASLRFQIACIGAFVQNHAGVGAQAPVDLSRPGIYRMDTAPLYSAVKNR